jgi:DNA-binding response OmpR family regulator
MAKIMIVDDDVKVTTLFKRFLTSVGHEVTALNQSLKAIQTANSVHPDLFILDIMMPQPDGYKLCGLLRAIPAFAHTPILIISALDFSNSKATSFGADEYLTKPFDLDDLAIKITALINRTRRNQ